MDGCCWKHGRNPSQACFNSCTSVKAFPRWGTDDVTCKSLNGYFIPSVGCSNLGTDWWFANAPNSKASGLNMLFRASISTSRIVPVFHPLVLRKALDFGISFDITARPEMYPSRFPKTDASGATCLGWLGWISQPPTSCQSMSQKFKDSKVMMQLK